MYFFIAPVISLVQPFFSGAILISRIAEMVVQRLSFQAATGKLQVIAVWRCLTRSGARVCRWGMHVDRSTGKESMTVDIVGSSSLNTDDIAEMLGDTRLQLTVTLFHMAVVSNSAVAQERCNTHSQEAANSIAIARPHPRLTLVRDITRHVVRIERD
ncbi:hypothetical protein [Burkholderia stagnalis]|uniref:hypothetical protein n=1 Tax=Burkholderia stagnalis TaxID=1503054 RepID=UPI0012D8FE18|nr:hypothetical protein [Burkholderia stagnalis]